MSAGEQIVFSVPLPHVALRRNSETKNHHYRSKLVREWQEEVWCAGWEVLSRIVQTDTFDGRMKLRVRYNRRGGWFPWKEASVHYRWYSTHPTDEDNIVASCKPLLDVLKASGPRPLSIIVDDGPGVSVTAEWVRESSRAKGRIEVTIVRGEDGC